MMRSIQIPDDQTIRSVFAFIFFVSIVINDSFVLELFKTIKKHFLFSMGHKLA